MLKMLRSFGCYDLQNLKIFAQPKLEFKLIKKTVLKTIKISLNESHKIKHWLDCDFSSKIHGSFSFKFWFSIEKGMFWSKMTYNNLMKFKKLVFLTEIGIFWVKNGHR